jgi:25S rRNA (uracil2843-N3)-methyltransferase
MARYERKAKSQPKHGPASVSAAPKTPVIPVQRPGWKGPGYVKKAPRRPAAAPDAAARAPELEQDVPEALQQQVLDVVREALPAVDDFDALKSPLRAIKDALVGRDWDRAFGSEEDRERYVIRWGPSRALACANVMAWLCAEHQEEDEMLSRLTGAVPAGGPVNVVSFGRGPADFLGLVAMLKHFHPTAAGRSDAEDAVSDEHLLSIKLVDAFDWSQVTAKLHKILTTPRPLSQYASAKAKASNNAPVSPEALTWSSTRAAVLDHSVQDLRALIGPAPALLTFFFSLHDLYTTSIAKTSAFLLRLTAAAPPGSLLVVVEEADAEVASQAAAAAQDKKFAIDRLMYQILTPPQPPRKKNEDPVALPWEKLAAQESTLFRMDKGLAFPGSLENIKLQMHLLRRL